MKIQEKDILYEDNHLIAVNKPATILVQGDHTNDKPLVEMVRSFIKKKEADQTIRLINRFILFDRRYVKQSTVTCQSIHATR